MSATNKPLLLVGFRRGSLRAARKLGLSPRLVHDKPLPDDIAVDLPAAHRRMLPLAQAAQAVPELLAGQAPAAVLATGEGSVIPAANIRAAFGLPGNTVDTAQRCADKITMKRAMQAAAIKTTKWRTVDPRIAPARQADDLIDALGLPLVVKQSQASGSRGQVIARTRAQVVDVLTTISTPESMLAEQFVHGGEMSVESFVESGKVVFTNPTAYLVPGFANLVPAPLSCELQAAIETLNAQAVAALGVERGMTHLEVYLTPSGPLFGELAIRPPGGRIMQLLQRSWGFSPWQAAIELELGRATTLPTKPKRTSAVWLLHPGPGRLKAIHGLQTAQQTPGIRQVRCRVEAGDEIKTRQGTGQDVGFIEAEGADPQAVEGALRTAFGALSFEFAEAGE